MRIYLAGNASHYDWYTDTDLALAAEAVLEVGYRRHLATFAYLTEVNRWAVIWSRMRCEILVDSGAFTAWSLGRPMSLRRYAAFIKAFPEHYPFADDVTFMNLDVIGDQHSTWRNYTQLRRLGCDVLPIVTARGSTARDVDRAMDESPRFAVGGLVGHKDPSPFLSMAFGRVMERRERTGVMPKVHLLGVASLPLLRAFPAYSSDASNWIAVLRWGAGLGGRQTTFHRSSADAAMARRTLVDHVRRTDALARQLTNLWTRKGVTFDEDDHGADHQPAPEPVEPEQGDAAGSSGRS